MIPFVTTSLLRKRWRRSECVAVDFTVSQRVAVGSIPSMIVSFLRKCWRMFWRRLHGCLTLQYTATHCNTPRHTATHCNRFWRRLHGCLTLQYTATHCNAPRHTATHCNRFWRRLHGCLEVGWILKSPTLCAASSSTVIQFLESQLDIEFSI